MQFKSITVIAVLLLVVASLLVAGCTTSTTSNTNQTPSATPTATPTPLPTAAPLVSTNAVTPTSPTNVATPTPVVIPQNAVVQTATLGQPITQDGLTITLASFGKGATPAGFPNGYYVTYSYSITGSYQYNPLTPPTSVITMTDGAQRIGTLTIGYSTTNVNVSGQQTTNVPQGSTPVSLEIVYHPSSDATYVYKWQL
jgi:hypothetical protein